jgi:hypothetical protein
VWLRRLYLATVSERGVYTGQFVRLHRRGSGNLLAMDEAAPSAGPLSRLQAFENRKFSSQMKLEIVIAASLHYTLFERGLYSLM